MIWRVLTPVALGACLTGLLAFAIGGWEVFAEGYLRLGESELVWATMARSIRRCWLPTMGITLTVWLFLAGLGLRGVGAVAASVAAVLVGWWSTKDAVQSLAHWLWVVGDRTNWLQPFAGIADNPWFSLGVLVILGFVFPILRDRGVLTPPHLAGRRPTLWGLGLLSLLLGATVTWFAQPKASASAPVVLIIVDTLRADHVGAYGNPDGLTPNIDRLASEGVVYEWAFAPTPWTSPSVAGLISGIHPRELGYVDAPVRLDRSVLTLAERLRGKGYQTGAFVANLLASSHLAFDQGFDHFDQSQAQGFTHISSPAITDLGLDFVDGVSGPFLLHLHYFDPHYGWVPHQGFTQPQNYQGGIQMHWGMAELTDFAPQMTEEDKGFLRGLYEGEVAFTDHHVGRLLDGLEAKGILDTAWVVFVADHGEEFAERDPPWVGHSRTVFHEQIRVPLIIRPPGGLSTPERVNTPVSIVDVTPALLGHLGLGSRHELDVPRDIMAEALRGAEQHMLVRSPYKLIVDAEGGKTLFHLVDDPGEQQPIEDVDTIDEMAQALDQWLSGSQGQATEADFTDEEQQMLEALGYVE